MRDQDYMKLALRLARRGLGKTSPNPMVGAVIVKEGRIIARGYHHYFGGDHAEIDAVRNASESVEGGTLYVTLEPCSHYGKTPPCVDALVRNKIRRVVAASLDPNPRVNGRGIAILQQHGIETTVGVLDEACRSLNEAHFKYMTTGVPLVTVKLAQTVDGRIATVTGSSRWISSEPSRRLAHRLRATNDAVMVGIGTVITDDPQLTVRLVRGKNPVRVIVDSSLRLPPEASVVSTRGVAPIVVATTSRADEKKLTLLRELGIEVLVLPKDDAGEVDLKHLLALLGQRGISSLLVEGGSGVITSLLRLGLVDRLVIIVAPKVLGKGIEAVGELNIEDVSQAIKLSFRKTYRSGEDLVIEAEVRRDIG